MSYLIRFYIKCLLDTVLSIFGIIILSPVLLLTAVIIFLDDPGPVLFSQYRAGRWHRPFRIYKFRTMKLNTPSVSTEELRQMNISPYTRLGPVLRRLSLDEIPQLFNVLRGEMSLIGPRPALMSQHRVLAGRKKLGIQSLRPGLTGLAQINGRDDLSDDEKVYYDKSYLDKFSFSQDLSIMIETLRIIFKSRGAY